MGEAAGRNREESPVFYYSFRQQPPAPYTRVGARVTLPSYGMSLTIWTSRRGTELWQIGTWRIRCPATGSTWRDQAIGTTRVFRRGRRLPTRSARFNIWAIRSPLEVANIHGLSVFDSVDTAVRGEPFAAR
jgi:hypothetical protein